MRPKPYIGITGITQPHEEATIFRRLELKSDARVMLGVCVSNKTLYGGRATRHPARYPEPRTISTLLSDDPRALNLLHFNTHEREKLLDDMKLAQKIAGPFCHGFQLNMPWPDIETLKWYKNTMPSGHNTVVLQCGKTALEKVEHSAPRLAERVAQYQGCIDYVLVDASGGGEPFDASATKGYFTELEKLGDVGFGVAGGLSPATLPRLRRLWSLFPDFSIDAESGLRDEQDALVMSQACNYLLGGDEMFVQRKYAHTQAA